MIVLRESRLETNISSPGVIMVITALLRLLSDAVSEKVP